MNMFEFCILQDRTYVVCHGTVFMDDRSFTQNRVITIPPSANMIRLLFPDSPYPKIIQIPIGVWRVKKMKDQFEPAY